jgi:hypothetical protein
VVASLATAMVECNDRAEKLWIEREGAAQKPSNVAFSEAALAQFCGYCGLPWSRRNKLPGHFAQIDKGSKKADKVLELNTICKSLENDDPSFMGFQNSKLFDKLIAHDYTPGITAEDAHTGVHPIAFILKTFNKARQEEEANKAYDKANNIMVRYARAQSKSTVPDSVVERGTPFLQCYSQFLQRYYTGMVDMAPLIIWLL